MSASLTSQDARQDSVKAPLKSFKQRRNFGKRSMICATVDGVNYMLVMVVRGICSVYQH